MPLPKTAAFWNYAKNMKVAKYMSAWANTDIGSSYVRWAGVGAGLGAMRGLAENVMNTDQNKRVGVIGGTLRGAMMGAGARGVKQLWSNRASIRNKATSAFHNARAAFR